MRNSCFTILAILFATTSFANEVKLITNRGVGEQPPLQELKEKLSPTDVYDLSFVAYDEKFAEELGLKSEYISEMDKGLRWFEIRILTEGNFTRCYYNLALDKTLKLALPLENFDRAIPLPTLPNKGVYEDSPQDAWPKLKELRGEQSTLIYKNKAYVAGYNPMLKQSRAGTRGYISYHFQDRGPHYQFISLSTNCLFDKHAYNKKLEGFVPAVWLGNNDKVGYSAVTPLDNEHYRPFIIPERIASQAYPFILRLRESVAASLNKE